MKIYSLTKHLAPSAAEMPFIDIVLVNFVNLSVMTKRYLLRLGILMNSPNMSMYTNVSGSIVGNKWSCSTFLRK